MFIKQIFGSIFWNKAAAYLPDLLLEFFLRISKSDSLRTPHSIFQSKELNLVSIPFLLIISEQSWSLFMKWLSLRTVLKNACSWDSPKIFKILLQSMTLLFLILYFWSLFISIKIVFMQTHIRDIYTSVIPIYSLFINCKITVIFALHGTYFLQSYIFKRYTVVHYEFL